MTTKPAGLRERVREAIANQPFKTVTVLSSLLTAQDELGYLPEEAIEEVALLTGTSVNTVWGVASFYPNFRFTPPARHIVEVCWGPPCHVLGAQAIFQGLLANLGLDREGESADGAITLKMNPCLGVCPHGPAMSFDHHLAGHMTLDKAAKRVDQLRATGPKAASDEALPAMDGRRGSPGKPGSFRAPGPESRGDRPA